MILTAVFLTIAIGVLAFAVITEPLYKAAVKESLPPDTPMQMGIEADYQRHLGWLRDLDVEREAKKIDIPDYNRQRRILQTETEDLFKQLCALNESVEKPGDTEIEGMINNRRMTRVERSAGFCVKCGMPLQQSDLFCPNCGLKLK